MMNKTILWQHSFMPIEVKILYIHIRHFTCATIPVLCSAASLASVSFMTAQTCGSAEVTIVKILIRCDISDLNNSYDYSQIQHPSQKE